MCPLLTIHPCSAQCLDLLPAPLQAVCDCTAVLSYVESSYVQSKNFVNITEAARHPATAHAPHTLPSTTCQLQHASRLFIALYAAASRDDPFHHLVAVQCMTACPLVGQHAQGSLATGSIRTPQQPLLVSHAPYCYHDTRKSMLT